MEKEEPIIEFTSKSKIKIRFDDNGCFVFSFPKSYGKARARKFAEKYLNEHSDELIKWRDNAQRKSDAQKKNLEKFSIDENNIEYYREIARSRILPKVNYWSNKMNLYPTSVKITSAKTRYGSCSSKNTVCFSLRLALFPDNCLDYVVIHELSHIRFHDHSSSFYELVDKYCPDRKQCEDILQGREKK